MHTTQILSLLHKSSDRSIFKYLCEMFVFLRPKNSCLFTVSWEFEWTLQSFPPAGARAKPSARQKLIVLFWRTARAQHNPSPALSAFYIQSSIEHNRGRTQEQIETKRERERDFTQRLPREGKASSFLLYNISEKKLVVLKYPHRLYGSVAFTSVFSRYNLSALVIHAFVEVYQCVFFS